MAQQFGLGRGLSSLIPQKDASQQAPAAQQVSPRAGADAAPDAAAAAAPADGALRTVPLTAIVPNPHQPRLAFDKEKLRELAASIKEHGVLQPLVVTERARGAYELIAGERRFRAAQMAGLTRVPVLVRAASPRQKMELALIENIQRHDLTLIEEAKAYKQLMETEGLSQEEVAARVGKSRSVVANRLRLLTLPITILKAVSDGTISEGHAKVILSLESTEAQHALFALITREGLTVRQAEQRAAASAPRRRKQRAAAPTVPAVAQAQKALESALETRVAIVPRGRGGKIVIDYYEPEDLRALVRTLRDAAASAEE